LVYGYPVLGVALLLGAIGLPVPSGVTAAAAGALAAQGLFDLQLAAVVAMAGLLAGDVAGYYLGRWAGYAVLERRSAWLGLTRGGVVRAERWFNRWAGLSILLTSSLFTVLSTPVNLLAGASRYQMRWYLPFHAVGRLVWTALYISAGFAFSESVEDLAELLGDLTGLVASVVLLLLLLVAAKQWGKDLLRPGKRP
jgi:membrane protein DedA with SNARE-associated domain